MAHNMKVYSDWGGQQGTGCDPANHLNGIDNPTPLISFYPENQAVRPLYLASDDVVQPSWATIALQGTSAATLLIEPSKTLIVDNTNWVRAKTYTYDVDYRMTSETALGKSETDISGVLRTAYTYNDIKTDHFYTEFKASLADGQVFNAINSVKHTIFGSKIRNTQDTYDSSGCLITNERNGDQFFITVTTYIYHPGGLEWTAHLPDDNGYRIYGEPLTREYGDQVLNVSNSDLSRSFHYDAFGNIGWESFSNAAASGGGYVASVDGVGTRTWRTSYIFRSYNGFGQQVWEANYHQPNDAWVHRKIWNYLSSGELDSSWTDNAKNLTKYTIATTGNDIGKVTEINKGIGTGNGSSSSITTSHQKIAVSYDEFGRQKAAKEVGTSETAGSTMYYDTLDRLVSSTKPDGNQDATAYSLSGTPSFQYNAGGPQTRDNTDYHDKTVDELGRVTVDHRVTKDDSISELHSLDYVSRIYYDVNDHPIAIVDGSLEANGISDNQITMMRYDSEGRLIGKISPPLKSRVETVATNAYTDLRKPITLYEYDARGRKTKEKTLLYGALDLTGATAAPDTDFAITSTVYDRWDRVIKVTDPNGAVTDLEYDPMGHVITLTKDFDSRRVTTYFAYDAVGHKVTEVNPDGRSKQWAYNPDGRLESETNELGYVTKGYTYTPDGLLQGTYQPKIGSGALAKTFVPANFTLMEWDVYGNRPYPTSIYKPNMDNVPAGNTTDGSASGGVLTTRVYDYAGRVSKTTLPNGGIVTQGYNARGNVISLVDADGFTTNFDYDPLERLRAKRELARASNTVDNTAFSGLSTNGISSTYIYDFAGNMVKKTEAGLTTDYVYNSLGKVIAESRPHKATMTTAPYKKYAYRLDGKKVAEANYVYTGNLSTFLTGANRVGTGASSPTVTAGNLQVFALDANGNVMSESSHSSMGMEKYVQYTYNKVNLRTKRDFQGDPNIYAIQRDVNGKWVSASIDPLVGTVNDTRFTTTWQYTLLGLLSYEVSTLPASNDAFNAQYLYYNGLGKISSESSECKVKIPNFKTNVALGTSIGLAGSVKYAWIGYNERGLVLDTTINNTSAISIKEDGKPETYTTTNTYYADGNKYESTVNRTTVSPSVKVGYSSYTYDTLGRQTVVTDLNGATDTRLDIPAALRKNISGTATSTTTYLGGGQFSLKVTDGTGKCYFQQDTKTTIGGRVAESSEWEWNPQDPVATNGVAYDNVTCGLGAPSRKTTASYNTDSTVKDRTVAFRQVLVNNEGWHDLKMNSTQVTSSTLTDYGQPDTETTNMSSTRVGKKGILNQTCQSTNTTLYNPSTTAGNFTYNECVGGVPTPKTVSVAGGTYVPNPTTGVLEFKGGTLPVVSGAMAWDGTISFTTIDNYNNTETSNRTIKNTYDDNGAVKTAVHSTTDSAPPATNNGNAGQFKLDSLEVKAYIALKQELANASVTYTLDSRGNRLKVAGGKYDNFIKRYDPEDRAYMFFKYDASSTLTNQYASYNDFRYDPFGNQVLASTGGLKQDVNGAWEIVRDVSSTLMVGGEVQLIRKRVGYIASNGMDTYTANDLFRDQTYSSADGIVDGTTWEGIVPFTALPNTGGTYPLEAPQEAFSSRLGLDVAAVELPATSGVPNPNPGEVKPPSAPATGSSATKPSTGSATTATPASSQTTKPAAPTSATSSNSSTTITTPDFGVTVTNLAPASTPSTSSTSTSSNQSSTASGSASTSTPASSSTGAFSAQYALEAPSSVLPASITNTLDPTGVIAPTSGATALPVTGTDPGSVLPPAGTTTPQVGSTPQDGASTIKPPTSSTGGVVPPATNAPEAGTVKPPLGKGKDFKPFEIIAIPTAIFNQIVNDLDDIFGPIAALDIRNEKNLEKTDLIIKHAWQDAIGIAMKKVYNLLQNKFHISINDIDKGRAEIYTKGMGLMSQLTFWVGTLIGLMTGDITPREFTKWVLEISRDLLYYKAMQRRDKKVVGGDDPFRLVGKMLKELSRNNKLLLATMMSALLKSTLDFKKRAITGLERYSSVGSRIPGASTSQGLTTNPLTGSLQSITSINTGTKAQNDSVATIADKILTTLSVAGSGYEIPVEIGKELAGTATIASKIALGLGVTLLALGIIIDLAQVVESCSSGNAIAAGLAVTSIGVGSYFVGEAIVGGAVALLDSALVIAFPGLGLVIVLAGTALVGGLGYGSYLAGNKAQDAFCPPK
jgi:YD repeat-containing protein